MRNKINLFANLRMQKYHIEANYDYLSCKIDWSQNKLICVGSLKPLESTDLYRIKIDYKVGYPPKVYILSPDIRPSKHIHMYSDKSLCLFYEPDLKWTEKTQIFKYTIPWISEWIIFYELYLLNGNVWKGKESPFHICET